MQGQLIARDVPAQGDHEQEQNDENQSGNGKRMVGGRVRRHSHRPSICGPYGWIVLLTVYRMHTRART